jgi:hypothetical protein
VSVYRAANEWQAHLVRGCLLDEGVPAVLQSHMVPGFATVMTPQTGCWGEVLVPEVCETVARVVLESALPAGEACS